MATKPKRPRDPFQLAKLIGDISTGQTVITKRTVKKRKGSIKGVGKKARQ